MKKLQILGTGCPKCKKLTENAQAAAKDLDIEFEIEKVTEPSLEPKSDEERIQREKIQSLVERIKKTAEEKKLHKNPSKGIK